MEVVNSKRGEVESSSANGSTRSETILDNLVAIILSLALFPSFIAWAKGTSGFSAFLASHLGPINPIKIGAPVLLVYAWKQRASFSRRALSFIAVLFVVGTLSALYAGIRCHAPWIEMREWGAMVLGCLAGACLALLPMRKAFIVTSVWMLVLISSVMLEIMFPSALSWILSHYFDPNRADLGIKGIMGLWDQASLAKMSAFGIWVFGYFLFKNFGETSNANLKRLWGVFLGTALVFVLIVLGTTQRGPVLGLIIGTAALIIRRITVTKSFKSAGIALSLATTALGLAFVILPKDVFVPRIKSMLFIPDQSAYGVNSAYTRDERFRLSQLSFEIISQYPMGNACIPPDTFAKYHLVSSQYHAHSLFLQQYRSKGWIWGTLHFLVFCIALIFAYRQRTISGNLLFAGLFTVVGLGLVDHPWFVLNQATIIGSLLVMGFVRSQSCTDSLRA